MKDGIKVFGILLIGVLVAIVIYPFLHELGHTLAALFTGSTVYEFRLFPIPYVMCSGAEMSGFESAIIGVSGMILPFIISLLFNSKKFWLWLFSFYLRGISTLAFALSYIAVLCYESEIIWENEDIVKTIELSGISSSVWLVMMLLLFCISASIIYFNKPIRRIETFFEL